MYPRRLLYRNRNGTLNPCPKCGSDEVGIESHGKYTYFVCYVEECKYEVIV